MVTFNLTSHFCLRGLLRLVLLLCLSINGSLSFAQQDISFSASIDRERLYVGESLILTLTIANGKPSNLTSFPDIDGIQVKPLGTKSNISWINGEQMQSQSYDYLLTPERPGKFTIPKFVVTVNGRIFSSEPKTFEALARDVSNDTAGASDLELYGAFLQIVNPPEKVYVGQVIPIELRLYYIEGGNISYPTLDGEGWSFGKVTGNEMGRQVLNGRYFNLAIFQFSATAYKTGTLKLGPFQCEMNVPVDPGAGSRRGNSLFGFNTRRYQKVPISTHEPAEVLGIPLPKDQVPASFHGAIGRFDLQVTPLSTEVREGDPITLRLRVYGEGNFSSITFPMTEQWEDFKSYPPEIQWEPQNNLEIRGTKVFELTIVPDDREVNEIPQIEWSYFDPEKSAYETVKRGPYKITVSPSSAIVSKAPESFSVETEDNPGPEKNWAHIKPRLGDPVSFAAAWTHQRWFWALGGVPWLALVALLGWNHWVRPGQITRSMDPIRQLKMSWLQNCQEMKKHLGESDWQAFYSSLYRGVQMSLGVYWGIPSESITQNTIDHHHQIKPLPEDFLKTVHDLFNRCDQIRYAPLRGGLKEMKEDFPKVEKLIEFVSGELGNDLEKRGTHSA